jgi:hypothetical protein
MRVAGSGLVEKAVSSSVRHPGSGRGRPSRSAGGTNPGSTLTAMLTNPALTGMPRPAFDRLVAISEPYWDALAEAAFQRRFHRPRSYLHPQTSTPRGSPGPTRGCGWRSSAPTPGSSPIS